jgi:toxin ParE1/3/4
VSGKPLQMRPAARADVLEVAAHYRADSGLGIALAFTDALQRTLAQIAQRAGGELPPPGALPAYDELLDMPGLRAATLKRFPQLVFHIERADHVDVLRVLHAKRDLPASLRPTG